MPAPTSPEPRDGGAAHNPADPRATAGPSSTPDPVPPRVTPAALGLVGVILIATIGFVGYSLLRSNPEVDNAANVPTVGAGFTVVGSDLKAVDGIKTEGCDAEPPSPDSVACSIAQTDLPRQVTVVPKAGLIRAWTVRGATGEVALQVIRTSGDRTVQVSRSATERVPTTGPHRFTTSLQAGVGDVIAVVLAPGAGVGMRPSPQAATVRWDAPVEAGADAGKGRVGLRREMLVRAELEPGATD